MPDFEIKVADTSKELKEILQKDGAIDPSAYSEMDVMIMGSMVDNLSSTSLYEVAYIISPDRSKSLKQGWSFYPTGDIGGFEESDFEQIGTNYMAIASEAHSMTYLEDTKILLYMPVHVFSQPTFTDFAEGPGGLTVKINYSENEKEGTRETFGKLPSGQSQTNVINSMVDNLARDSYQALISRQTIPNVIRNVPKQIKIRNIGTEGVSAVDVSLTSTSTTTY
tara:strand:+ start:17 stop:685 length:669 start_codon:yes stop_codon:yes gene_type:complete